MEGTCENRGSNQDKNKNDPDGKNELDCRTLIKGQPHSCKKMTGKTMCIMHKHLLGLCCLPSDTIAGLENMVTCYVNLKEVEKDVTPLHAAILLGDNNLCRQIVSKKTDVNKGSLYGKSALSLALDQNNYNIAKLLIKKKADVNFVDSEGKAPLYYAIQKDTPESVVADLLAAGAEKDGIIHKKKRTTPLAKAVEVENIEVIKLLLENNVNLNPNTSGCANPLNVAIIKKSLEITELLVKHGASPEGPGNTDFFSPLIAVLYSQDTRFLEVLCTAVQDINKILPPKVIGIPLKTCKETLVTSGTWLHMAVYLCNPDAVNFLLHKGASINIPEPYDLFTPLHAAAKLSEANMTELKKADYRRVVEMLLDRGADVKAQCKRGKTPLEYIILRRNWTALEEFVKAGLDVNKEISPNISLTPFQLVVTRNEKKLVQLCIEYGADCSLAVEEMAPLHIALAQNDPLLVKTLLKHTDELQDSVLLGSSVEDFSDELKISLNAEAELAKGVEEGDEEKVQQCLGKGALSTGSLMGMKNPLHFAASKGFSKVVLQLLENGAQSSQLNSDGVSPLFLAAENGFVETCKFLLRYGASYNYKGPKGITPVMMVNLAIEKDKNQVYTFSSNDAIKCDQSREHKRNRKIFNKKRSGEGISSRIELNHNINKQSRKILKPVFNIVNNECNEEKHFSPEYKLGRNNELQHLNVQNRFTNSGEKIEEGALTNDLKEVRYKLRCNAKAIKRRNISGRGINTIKSIDLMNNVLVTEDFVPSLKSSFLPCSSETNLIDSQNTGNRKMGITPEKLAIDESSLVNSNAVGFFEQKERACLGQHSFVDDQVEVKCSGDGDKCNLAFGSGLYSKNHSTFKMSSQCPSEPFEFLSQKHAKNTDIDKSIFKKFTSLSTNLDALEKETDRQDVQVFYNNSPDKGQTKKIKKTKNNPEGGFKVSENIGSFVSFKENTALDESEIKVPTIERTADQSRKECKNLQQVKKLFTEVHKLFKMVEKNNMKVLVKLWSMKNSDDVTCFINCTNRKGNTLIGEALSLDHCVIARGIMRIRLNTER